jgi:hypothetical protein
MVQISPSSNWRHPESGFSRVKDLARIKNSLVRYACAMRQPQAYAETGPSR